MVQWQRVLGHGLDMGLDPYELWYLHGPGDAPGGATHPPDMWTPRLLTLGFAASALPIAIERVELFRMTLEAVFGVQGNDVALTAHDLAHGIKTWVESGGRLMELLAFVRVSVSDDALTQGIRSRWQPVEGADLAALITVAVRASGAPTPATGESAGLRGELDGLARYLLDPIRSETPGPVVGVVIDHAIGFANRQFRGLDPAGRPTTRFDALWIQDQALGSAGGPGLELRSGDIDAALQWLAADPAVSEVQVYERLGVLSLPGDHMRGTGRQALRATHGTAVTQLAFGADPESGDDAMRGVRLLGVQLPYASVAQTHGLLHDLYVYSALNWVWLQGVRAALSGAGAYPRFFLNHSFGTYAGRDDGFDMISAEFDKRLADGTLAAITVAAGNSFQAATLARLEAGELSDPAMNALGLFVQPDNRATTFVRLWVDGDPDPAGAVPLTLELHLPDGTTISPQQGRALEIGEILDGFSADGRTRLARLYAQIDGPRSIASERAPERLCVTLVVPPTADAQGQPTGVPDGHWRLGFSPLAGSAPPALTIRVERGDTPDGFPRRGRQARLTHPAYRRHDDLGHRVETDSPDCPIKRLDTLSTAARSQGTIAVASHRVSDGAPSWFSSASSAKMLPRGGGGAGLPGQPRLSAASERSPARPHVLVSGTLSGSVVASTGTSLSAPTVMRRLVLAALSDSSRPPIDQVLAQTAPSNNAPPGEGYRVGFGRLPFDTPFGQG